MWPARFLSLLFAPFILTACAIPGQLDLPELIVRRLSWMDEVAEVKRARGLPIFDPARENAVLDEMEALAKEQGVDQDSARLFFEGQMRAARVFQQEWLDQPTPARKQPLPDLATEIRPALDQIGRQMVQALRAARLRDDSRPLLDETQRELTQAGYSKTVTAAAMAGLRQSVQFRGR